MALLKQKEEMSTGSTLTHSPPPKPGTMSYTEPIVPAPQDKSLPKKYGINDILVFKNVEKKNQYLTAGW